jgi:hypothetical protein
MQRVLESLVNTRQTSAIGMHEGKGRSVLSVSEQVRDLLVGRHSADTSMPCVAIRSSAKLKLLVMK